MARGSHAGAGAAGSVSAAGSFSSPGGGNLPAGALPDGGAPTGSTGFRDRVVLDTCTAMNAAGISDADLQALRAGSPDPGALRVLYPYDATVFPRGMLAPVLMWDGAGAEAVYVHIKSQTFEYHGCLKPTGDNQLALPQDVWEQASAQTHGKQDPYTLELTVLSGGVATGPVAQTLSIAQATIKGSIYYNSYVSALGFTSGGKGGVVLRIPPGGMAQAFVFAECNGCHSVSANGSRLISQTVATGGRSYMLTATTGPNPMVANGGIRTAFGALYPDGSKYLATSTWNEVGRAGRVATGSHPDSVLVDAATGVTLPSTGIPTSALMPSFSPSGKLLAFTDFAVDAAHALAVMDYDVATDTARNHRVLHRESGINRPAWPFILPDDAGIIFTSTNGEDFSGGSVGVIPGTAISGVAPFSELQLLDLKTGTSTVLAKAMGYDTPADAPTGKTYLPFGAADLHASYFPTVSPVAAGGYFWVFFDSIRNYGNLGSQRALWGTAVDIDANGDYTTDRSHPAFYLPGQEFGTGNHRAFAALDPCKMDGTDCTSGTDCCGGFCTIVEDPNSEFMMEPKGTCSSKVPMCSRRDEGCVTDDDCCDPDDPSAPRNNCLAGYCAYIPPVE